MWVRNNKIYIFGGRTGEVELVDMWEFDPIAVRWSLITSNNNVAGAAFCKAIYMNDTDTLYILPGPSPNTNGHTADPWTYSWSTSSWSRMGTGSPPSARYLPCVFVYNGVLYYLMGYQSDFSTYNLAMTLNLATPTTWTTIDTLQYDIPYGSNSLYQRSTQCAVASVTNQFTGVTRTFAFFFGGANTVSNLTMLGTETRVWNDVYSFQLPGFTFQLAVPNFAFPPARAFHTANTIGSALYIYGGRDANGAAMTDMWRIDLGSNTATWSRVVTGASPPARHSHVSTTFGDQIFIFGGVATTGEILGDMWSFSANQALWKAELTTVTPSATPAARYGGFMITMDSKFYIGFGQGKTGGMNDIWEYDPTTLIWVNLKPTVVRGVLAPLILYPLASLNFFATTQPDGSVTMSPRLVVFGGLGLNNKPNGNLWIYGRAENSISTLDVSNTYDFFRRHQARFFTSGQMVSFVGGANAQGPYNLPTIVSIMLDRFANGTYTLSPTGHSSGTYLTSGYAAVTYGNNFYMHGGYVTQTNNPLGRAPFFFRAVTSVLQKLTFNPVCTATRRIADTDRYISGLVQYQYTGSTICSSCAQYAANVTDWCVMCAPGSYAQITGGTATCQPCDAGTFSMYAGSVARCQPCAPGFYNPRIGATSGRLCLACPPGTYSSTSGSSSCSPCPAGKVCPLAASSAYDVSTFNATPPRFVQQPAAYQPKTDEVTRQQILVITVVFAVLGFILVVYALYEFVLRPRLGWTISFASLDLLYSDAHILMTKPTDLPYYEREWKTKHGGIFTLVFIFLAVVVTALVTLPLSIDNTDEKRLPIPNAVVPYTNEQVTASFTLRVTFQGYSQNCVMTNGTAFSPDTEYACDNVITNSMANVAGPAGNRVVQPTLTCQQPSFVSAASYPSCTVIWRCPQCTIAPAADSASVTLRITHLLAMATRIDWSLESTTGITNSNSILRNSLSPTGPTRAFRGPNPPTVNIRMMPGTFNSSIPGETGFATGFYLSLSSQTPGDEADNINFHYLPTLGFTMSFARIDSTLNVVHTVKTPLTVFLSSLAGALTSLLGALAGVMQLIETLTSTPPPDADKRKEPEKEHAELGGAAYNAVRTNDKEAGKPKDKDELELANVDKTEGK
eukprot:TRINITY_DN2746_c0_g2_i4.p1 TRINITY_DN2746_c0_g2~~TRINITY_DN2746_c0_g2_i4.p1  ORF type:complete len:1318 (+),score=510.54 TRINITY_DN2746_c0_g2_i4:570-3956(+)